MNRTFASYFINGAEIISKYFGESEAKLRRIFDSAFKNAPALIIIDEIDSLGRERSSGTSQEVRIVSTLLTAIDGAARKNGVVIIGTTNKPNSLDPALRRGGRLEKEIELGIPSSNEMREKIFTQFLSKFKLAFQLGDHLLSFAENSVGFSPADIKSVISKASSNAMKRALMSENNVFELKVDDIDLALANTEPSAMRKVAFLNLLLLVYS